MSHSEQLRSMSMFQILENVRGSSSALTRSDYCQQEEYAIRNGCSQRGEATERQPLDPAWPSFFQETASTAAAWNDIGPQLLAVDWYGVPPDGQGLAYLMDGCSSTAAFGPPKPLGFAALAAATSSSKRLIRLRFACVAVATVLC